MDILINNAFRILGLPVTASKRERVRRVEEIQTFITIGPTPHYDTDFPWIGELQRNEETVRKALQVLENPDTKLEHLLSWFWAIDEIDNLAMDALKNEDVDKAVEIWSVEAQQNDTHYKKNLATLEQILAFQASDSNYQHLKSSMNFWAEITSSAQLFHWTANLDLELSNITDGQVIQFVGSHISQTAKSFLDKWCHDNQLDRIGQFFSDLSESDLSPKIVDIIKENYVRPLSEKIDKLCNEYSHLDDYDDFDAYGRIILKTKAFHNTVLPYFEQVKQTGDAFLIERHGDKIGAILLDRAICYGNKSHKWQKSKELCKVAEAVITGPLLKDRLEKNLKVISDNIEHEKIWGNLSPIEKAPSLHTANGIGTTLYGYSNYDPKSESYETTRYFVFFGIPIIPLGRYRVTRDGDYYRYLGKVPFRPFDTWHLGLVLLVIIYGLFNLLNSDSETTSPSSSSHKTSSNSQEIKALGRRIDNAKLRLSTTDSETTSPSSSSHKTSSKSQEIKALGQRIDNAKLRLSTMESELLSSQSTLKIYEIKFERLKEDIDEAERKLRLGLYVDEFTYSSNIDDYNDLAQKYNTALENRQTQYDEYRRLLDATNTNVMRYNRLIGAD